MIEFSESTSVVDSAEIEHTCKICSACNLVDAIQVRTVTKLYWLIPVWIQHETAIKCPDCNTTFRSSANPQELARLSLEELESAFRVRIGLVEKFLIVTGWLLIPIGILSLIMFTIGYFMMPKAATGWRRSAVVGFVISILLTAAYVLILINNK